MSPGGTVIAYMNDFKLLIILVLARHVAGVPAP
jgi:hypothetical protein